jgi:hypothetical protein
MTNPFIGHFSVSVTQNLLSLFEVDPQTVPEHDDVKDDTLSTARV